MAYFKKIVGKRIYLSPVNPEDAETYCHFIADMTTSVPLGTGGSVLGLEQERAFLKGMEGVNFAIIDLETDKLLGNCSLFEISDIHRSAVLGIFIGEKANRGKGYGPEALELLLSFAFKIRNLHNVMLRVFSYNKRAIASYKKVGFIEVGRRREAHFLNGVYYDEVYMDILSREFSSEFLNPELEEIVG